jgi:hypothetical protein
MKENQILILNSTVLYVLAFLLTTIIHESGHAFLGYINTSEPVLHHNYVEYLSAAQLSTPQKMSISLAGPLISLLQGLIIGLFYLRLKKQTLCRLFLLWFSVLGFSNFFGYLMTGPIFQEGDIGKVFSLLNLPLTVQIIIAVIGAAILTYIAFKLTIPFLKFGYKQEWLFDPKSREHFLFRIIILPWIIGSIIVTILYFPIVAVISIIYPFTSGMIFIFPWRNAKRVETLKASENSKIGAYSILSYLSLIILVIIFRVILVPGIELF